MSRFVSSGVSAVFLLFMLISSGKSHEKSCHFVYSEHIKTDFALPEIKKVFSDWALFDLDRPIVERGKGGTVILLFLVGKDGFHGALDPQNFALEMDKCGTRVLSARGVDFAVTR